MANTKDDAMVECPECDVQVKEKNLGRHLDRSHGFSPSEIEDAMGANGTKGPKGKARGKGPYRQLPAVMALVVVLLFLVAYLVAPQGLDLLGIRDQGDGSDDGDGGTSDITPVTYTTTDGMEVHGTLYKSTNGKGTVILVHGLQEKKDVWDDLARHIKGNGYNALAIDLRGHGESLFKNGTRIDISTMSPEDFLGFVDDVSGAVNYSKMMGLPGKVTIIGASIGANAALRAAVRDSSVRGLVLLSPGLNYQGLTIEDVAPNYGHLVLLIACNQDAAGKDGVTILQSTMTGVPQGGLYTELGDNIGHGTQMLNSPGFDSQGKIDIFLERVVSA